MTQSVPAAVPPGAVAAGLPPAPVRARSDWELLPSLGVGPQPGEEVRGLLARRLRLLAPLLLSVLIFYFFRNLHVGSDLPASRFGLLLQLVLLALMTVSVTPLYWG